MGDRKTRIDIIAAAAHQRGNQVAHAKGAADPKECSAYTAEQRYRGFEALQPSVQRHERKLPWNELYGAI